jgi:16S rRNA (uracil1498-N3)-methyltransferase
MPSKRVPIFYASRLDEAAKSATIAGSEARHAVTVLRLRPGSSVRLLWEGAIWSGEMAAGGASSVRVALHGQIEAADKARPRVALLVATPKGHSADLIVQKATELGVSQVTFFDSKRSVPKIADGKRRLRLERWDRIARDACKQCGRAQAPFVGGPLDSEEALGLPGQFDLALLLDTEGKPLKIVLRRRRPKSVVLIVGPEGGFERREIAEFRRAGALCCSLNEAVLRTETAAISAASIVTHSLWRPGRSSVDVGK